MDEVSLPVISQDFCFRNKTVFLGDISFLFLFFSSFFFLLIYIYPVAMPASPPYWTRTAQPSAPSTEAQSFHAGGSYFPPVRSE